MKASFYGPWYLVAQRPHHLANFLCRSGNEVEVYTTRGFKPNRFKLPIRPSMQVGQQLPSRLYSLPLLGSLAHLYNESIERNVFRSFERSCADVHFHYRAPRPWSASLGPKVKCLIYDCVDNYSAFLGADPNTTKWEHELCDRADSIWVVSRYLEDRLARYSEKISYVPNGVDFEHFAMAQKIRKDTNGLNCLRPRLIYIGAIFDWFNVRLVGETATILSHWDIDLIGPVALSIEQRRHLDRPNIKFLGVRDYASLPIELATANVAMIPFTINDLIRGTSPIKLYEYLAAGVPVAASPMPEVLPYIEDGVVGCADTPFEFAQLVEDLARSANPFRCQEIAKQSSWAEIFLPEIIKLREKFL